MERIRYRFPFVRPDIPKPDEWLPYIELAYREGWYTNFGALSQRLEQALAARYGSGRAGLLVANGTSGLVAALHALDVTGKVIVPSFTFAATAQAVELAGGVPVLCDIDPVTWELAPEQLQAAIKEHAPTGVMTVRPFGLCRELDELEAICRDAGLPLIVDSAAALGGALSNGTPVGDAGDIEVFSLHATKTFGVGEGGLLLASPEVISRARSSINFGLDSEGYAVNRGQNGKASEFVAAIGLALLDRIDVSLAGRSAMAKRYQQLISSEFPQVVLPSEVGNSCWQTFPTLMPSERQAEAAQRALVAAGIEARRYYEPALHRMPRYRSADSGFPVASDVSERCVCLPVYPSIQPKELAELLAAVRSSLRVALRA